MCGVAEAAMAGSGGFDVLLIPGGIGTWKETANPQFLAELKRLAEASRIVATVCTGSLLLARRDCSTDARRHRISEYFGL